MGVKNPSRFEAPFDTWSEADKQEFLKLMNERRIPEFTMDDIRKYEYALEFDLNSKNEPLTKTQQLALLGYASDKLLKTRGKMAMIRVQYQLMKKGGKTLVDAFKSDTKQTGEVFDEDSSAGQAGDGAK